MHAQNVLLILEHRRTDASATGQLHRQCQPTRLSDVASSRSHPGLLSDRHVAALRPRFCSQLGLSLGCLEATSGEINTGVSRSRRLIV